MNQIIINTSSNNIINEVLIKILSWLGFLIGVTILLVSLKLLLPTVAWKFLIELKKDFFS